MLLKSVILFVMLIVFPAYLDKISIKPLNLMNP